MNEMLAMRIAVLILVAVVSFKAGKQSAVDELSKDVVRCIRQLPDEPRNILMNALGELRAKGGKKGL